MSMGMKIPIPRTVDSSTVASQPTNTGNYSTPDQVFPDSKKSITVAQLPIITGPITGTYPGIGPDRTNSSYARIGSYGEGSWNLIGGAGAKEREPLERVAASLNHEKYASAPSENGIFSELQKFKNQNGGEPLTRITIAAHGEPGLVWLGDRSRTSPVRLVREMLELGLLAKGGKVIFDSCSLAGDAESRESLRMGAKNYVVTIEASETYTTLGIPTFKWSFSPSGVAQRFFGL